MGQEWPAFPRCKSPNIAEQSKKSEWQNTPKEKSFPIENRNP